MRSSVSMYIIVLVVFLALDYLWLGWLMKGFYSQELGELARRQGNALSPRWLAAIGVYLLIPAGMILFVRPVIMDVRLWQAAVYGALYGLVVYGVYDLTNRAVIEKWSLLMTSVDIVWGCVICGITASIMRIAQNGRFD